MSVKRHISNRKGWVAAIVILIAVFDLFFLYFIKYKNQDISFTNFNLFNTGNLLNLLFTLLLILGLIINSVKSSPLKNSTLLVFISLMTLFLMLGTIGEGMNISTPNFYVFEHPFGKVLIGAIFSVYQFIQYFFISALWLRIFGVRDFLFIKSLVVSAIMVLMFLYFAFYFIHIKINADKKISLRKNSRNIAVVLGAAVWSHNKPSPSLASRVSKAISLYKEGYVGKIQLTGSNAPGELSEAQVAFNYLKNKGIDTSDVYLEKKTTSTIEQIHFIKNQLLRNKSYNDIIIVSDKYHLVRVKEICNFYNVNASIAPARFSMRKSELLYYEFHESVGLIVFWLFAL